MAAIVKANSTLTAGGLVVLKRNFSASESGQMNYSAEYLCLAQFASRQTPFFRTGSQPPTPLPANMLLLQLTKTPTLVDLQTQTSNGLTYFTATYSAGVETDVTITESSEIRNFSYTVKFPVGFTRRTPRYDHIGKRQLQADAVFVQTGEQVVTYSYDYVSITATASSKNTTLPNVRGGIGAKFNFNGNGNLAGRQTLIETVSKTKNSRGEYTYNKSSSGIIQ